MEGILLWLGEYGYLGLFVASFLAATVLPFGSEVLFTTLLYTTDADPWQCIWAAAIGNFLGAMTGYALGRVGKIEWLEKYLRIKKEDLEKWLPRVRKYSYVLVFFSFVPGIGDLMPVAAGYIRAKAVPISIIIIAGKLTRYIGWVYITYWAFN